MEEKRKIIMDVDTGTDDAVALIMAMLDEKVDLLGICSVNGNVGVELTTDNSLRVVELCEKQDTVKVYCGCEAPIASTLMPWTPQSTGIRSEGSIIYNDYHSMARRDMNKNGGKVPMHPDTLPLPEPTIKEGNESAVVWLINTLMAAEDNEITVIPVGPMTNIGVAMRAEPRICKKIREIVLMGGGHMVNNVSPATEFNIWADPEAAEIILHSGVKVTFVSLDATHSAYITEEQAKRIKEIGTKPADFVGDLILHRILAYGQRDVDMHDYKGAPVHDALAVCAVLYPEVLTEVLHTNVHVDISRGYAYGQTIVDRRLTQDEEPKNAYFALKADGSYFYEWMYSVLCKDKERRG